MSFEQIAVGILFILILGSYGYTSRVESNDRKGRNALWEEIRSLQTRKKKRVKSE